MRKPNGSPRAPAYREFWFWFVMAPLVAVLFVVAALLTAALRGADEVVVDNYYKHGRLINQSFAQDTRALELGLEGELTFDLSRNRVELQLDSVEDYILPGQLLLVMDHPVSADRDQHLELRRVASNRYRAQLDHTPEYEWFLTIYPELDLERRREADWRLRARAEFVAGEDKTLRVTAGSSERPR